MRLFIWLGLFVGSTAGSMVPQLWGAGVFSGWGLFFSMIGGVAGIWGGYKIQRAFF